jgi:hypothetical protein
MRSSQREYLTEISLGQFLRERVDATFVANQPIRDLGRRFRPTTTVRSINSLSSSTAINTIVQRGSLSETLSATPFSQKMASV